jgi:TRAP-type uncharacterized transport system fused permease subunit
MMATGIEAFRLGIAGFLMPFAFVFHPELLFRGSGPEVLAMAGFAAVSAIALASAVVGYAGGRLTGWERLAALAAAGLMVVYGPVWQVAGLGVFAAVVVWTARRGIVKTA